MWKRWRTSSEGLFSTLGPPANGWGFDSEPVVIFGGMDWIDFSPSPSLPIILYILLFFKKCVFVSYCSWYTLFQHSPSTHIALLTDLGETMPVTVSAVFWETSTHVWSSQGSYMTFKTRSLSLFYIQLRLCLQSALLGACCVRSRKQLSWC